MFLATKLLIISTKLSTLMENNTEESIICWSAIAKLFMEREFPLVTMKYWKVPPGGSLLELRKILIIKKGVIKGNLKRLLNIFLGVYPFKENCIFSRIK